MSSENTNSKKVKKFYNVEFVIRGWYEDSGCAQVEATSKAEAREAFKKLSRSKLESAIYHNETGEYKNTRPRVVEVWEDTVL